MKCNETFHFNLQIRDEKQQKQTEMQNKVKINRALKNTRKNMSQMQPLEINIACINEQKMVKFKTSL